MYKWKGIFVVSFERRSTQNRMESVEKKNPVDANVGTDGQQYSLVVAER